MRCWQVRISPLIAHWAWTAQTSHDLCKCQEQSRLDMGTGNHGLGLPRVATQRGQGSVGAAQLEALAAEITLTRLLHQKAQVKRRCRTCKVSTIFDQGPRRCSWPQLPMLASQLLIPSVDGTNEQRLPPGRHGSGTSRSTGCHHERSSSPSSWETCFESPSRHRDCVS